MGKVKIITADQAAALVEDNTTVTTSGFVASGMPEALTKALEKRFLETGLYFTLLPRETVTEAVRIILPTKE